MAQRVFKSISELKIIIKTVFLFLKESKFTYDWRQLLHRKKEMHKKIKIDQIFTSMPTSSYPIHPILF
jgi:hypothetical protein